MRKLPKWALALGAGATLLGGCAAYPDRYYDAGYIDRTNEVYYDRPYYYDYGPRYYHGPSVYVAPPAISLGFGYHRGWRHR
jgi:hypothetical protein